MANKTTSAEEVGYEVEVIGDYPSKLNCTICSLIMKKSMYGCQKHSFCKSCITKHIQCVLRNEGTVTCPGGCGETIIPLELQPNQFADLMINTLKTKCLNEYCSWQGDLLDLMQVHQINCDYTKVACDINGCGETFLTKDMELHQSNCLYNIIQCSYCHSDILQINEEKHELECELKEVKCEFYSIGCKVLFLRQDSHSHNISFQTQHTRLIYHDSKSQNSRCNDEIAKVREELLMSNAEVETLKQENVEIKIELIKLKKKSDDDEITKQLFKDDKIRKRQSVLPASKFRVHKALNFIFLVLLYLTINETKSQSNEINSTTNKTKIINNLKSKISEVPELLNWVYLINNDTAVIQVKRLISLDSSKQCYEHRQCDDVIDHLRLSNHKILLNELLLEIPNHLYEAKRDGYYGFYFQFDLNNVKDFHVSIPNKFNMTIFNKKVLVLKRTKVYLMVLYVGKYRIPLQNGVTFNLKQVDDSMLFNSYKLNNYGYLYIAW